MSALERLRERLPSLYRPEPGQRDLLSLWLEAAAQPLDGVEREAARVLQAHWQRHADRGLSHPFVVRSRELQGLPPPEPGLETEDHLLIGDLARLAALLPLPPVESPPEARETVEAYRLRIRRFVELYRRGLGTLGAVRRVIEATLPFDLSRPAAERDRPFQLEEHAPLGRHHVEVEARGAPVKLVGPLMHFTFDNDGLDAVAPTLYVEGVEPVPGKVDPTRQPVVELYAGSVRPPLGIAYTGTLAVGETLRLQPTRSSWLGGDAGLRRAGPATGGDPTVPGPWAAVAAGPTAPVTTILQAHDHTLWAAVANGTDGELWRFGSGEPLRLADLPAVHALAEGVEDLLVGTEDGLFRLALYPEEGTDFVATPIAGLEGQAVQALCADGPNRFWVGTSTGLFKLEGSEFTSFGLAEEHGTGTSIRALAVATDGVLFVAGDLGCGQYHPESSAWFWYTGGARSEQEGEWIELELDDEGRPTALPTAEEVFLPPIRSILALGGDLWLGTDRGVARYRARSVRGLTFETVLEAFPDLVDTPVFALSRDERGRVWLATGHGLLRFDGRDLWQGVDEAGSGWQRWGRADRLLTDASVERGTWRFERRGGDGAWQRLEAGGWRDFANAPVAAEFGPVHSLAWSDGAEAHLGQWDEAEKRFTPTSAIPEVALRVRVKPRPDRVIDGGPPALPRLPPGRSVWRYLALETEDDELSTRRPAWTVEGRLLPPPGEAPGPWPARFDLLTPPPEAKLGSEAVFAFRPAARVFAAWHARRAHTVLARLDDGEALDDAQVERVWRGMQQVRPAGVHTALAIGETIVREN